MGLDPDAIRECIRENVFDPEIGINVVDLGLLYDVEVRGGREVRLEMTLTTAGCPLVDVIRNDVERALREKFGEDLNVELEWVWDPPWTPEMMSEEARAQLGYL